MNRGILPALLGAALLVTSGTAVAVAQQSQADELMELERRWSAAFQEGNIDWIVNHHAAHGRVLPPGSKAFVGPEGIREFWTGLHETDGLELTFGPDEAYVSESEDMAYVLGHYTMTQPDGSTDEGKYVVVWVKEDGQWRIAADMFNSSLSPS